MRSGLEELVLLTLMGHTASALPFPRLLYLKYSTSWGSCQGVSYIFSEFFFESTYARATLTMASIRPRLPSPLDMIIIPHPTSNYKMAKYTKSGFFTLQYLCSLSIDKLAGGVYNGNSAQCARRRAAIITHDLKFVNRQNKQKNHFPFVGSDFVHFNQNSLA